MAVTDSIVLRQFGSGVNVPVLVETETPEMAYLGKLADPCFQKDHCAREAIVTKVH